MFLICTRNFPPDLGGIQNLMEGLSKALLNHGPVKIFTYETKDCQKYDETSGLDTVRINGFKIFRKYRKANLINEFCRNNSIRGIFFDHWKSIENIDYEIIKNIPTFCLIHSKEINHIVGSSLNKKMIKSFKKTKYIIANSNFTKNLAINKGAKPEKIKIIFPGCNYPIKIQEEYKKKTLEIYKESFPKIITVARLDKRKAHQNIFMCIKNLKTIYPKIKYVCVGDGEEKENLKKLRKELNLENEIILLDKIDENLKVALLDQANLFLMPSIVYKKSIEGFGISFIEAACYGKGSIGGKFGGEKDAIKENLTGYLCDGNDLNSIYETVLKFLKNDKYKELGTNAITFSKNFNWSKVVKKYIELI